MDSRGHHPSSIDVSFPKVSCPVSRRIIEEIALLSWGNIGIEMIKIAYADLGKMCVRVANGNRMLPCPLFRWV